MECWRTFGLEFPWPYVLQKNQVVHWTMPLGYHLLRYSLCLALESLITVKMLRNYIKKVRIKTETYKVNQKKKYLHFHTPPCHQTTTVRSGRILVLAAGSFDSIFRTYLRDHLFAVCTC